MGITGIILTHGDSINLVTILLLNAQYTALTISNNDKIVPSEYSTIFLKTPDYLSNSVNNFLGKD